MPIPMKISKDVTLYTKNQIKKTRLRPKLVEGEIATIKAETSEIKIRKTTQRIKIMKGWVRGLMRLLSSLRVLARKPDDLNSTART